MRVVSPTLGGLFAGAAEIVGSGICDRRTVRPTREVVVALRETDLGGLMVAWINEVIFLFDARRFLLRRCLDVRVGGVGLTATLAGEDFDGGRHRIGTLFKAATLHCLSVERTGGLWRATVVLDV